MMRTGTLIIESASDEPLLFDDVPQVERVHSLLYHEVLDERDDGFDDRYDSADRDEGRGHDGDSAYSRRVEVDRR